MEVGLTPMAALRFNGAALLRARRYDFSGFVQQLIREASTGPRF